MTVRGIGFLGGTFDPIHAGHLRAAHAALSAFGLARIDFVPAGDPWQKAEVTPGIHRLAMLRLGVEYEPRFTVNTCELERTGPTYTVDTLRAMREAVGPAMPLVLIIGDDQWANFHTWKDWEEIPALAHIAHVARNDAAGEADGAVLEAFRGRETAPEKLTETPAGGVCRFEMPPTDARSEVIRKLVRELPFAEAMRRIEGWISPDTAEHILRHGLYGAHRA